MVLKSIVASILNKYVGKYVKNFDSNNLNIGLWDGKVELSNLELREEALVELDLPIEVLSGYVGNLSLSIPWKSIYVDPVEIKVKDIFIIAGPRLERPYDEESELRHLNAKKQYQLETIEKGKKYQQKREETEDDKDDTLYEKLQAQILKNVQISVTNIHVRYEDKVTNPDSPFTVGVTLSEVAAKTTDSNWIPCYVDGSVRKIYKLLQMNCLAFYWNSDVSFFINGNSNWKSLMRNQITRRQNKAYNHQYILEPLSMLVQMEIDQDAKVLMEFPKYVMNVVLESLPLSLSKQQFNGIIKLMDSFSLMEVNQEYRKFKPKVPVKTNPKAWWMYAFNSIIEKVYKPWTWKWIKKHRGEYKKYVNLYCKKLEAEYLEDAKTLPLIIQKIQEQEEKLDVANILIARQQASNDFELEKESGIDDKAPEPVGWLEWLGVTSSGSIAIADDLTEDHMFSLVALSEDEKEELYIAIGYVNDTTHPVYSKEYVRSKLSISLDCCTIALKDSDKKAMVCLSLKRLITTVTERPGSEGYGFELQVENITSHQSDLKKKLDIIKPRERSSDNLLSLGFEINPVDSTAYYSLKLSLEPVNVNFHKTTVEILTDIFNVEDHEMLMELQQAANNKVAELKSTSRAGVEYVIMKNKVLYLDFNIKSPTIIIPHHDSKVAKAIHVYLGDLTVKTIMKSKLLQQSIREATESDLEVMFYHQTDIQLSNIHMGITDYDIESGFLEEKGCDDQVIPPICFNMNIYRCLKTGYANFPDFKISGELPLLKVNLDEDDVVYLYQFLKHFADEEAKEINNEKEVDRHSNSSLSKRKRSGPIVSQLSTLQDMLDQTKPFKDIEQKQLDDGAKLSSTDNDVVADSNHSYNSSIIGYDRTKLNATFKIQKIEVGYSAFVNGSVVNLWNLSLAFASCDVNVHMWDTQVKARLHAFEIKDNSSSSEELTIITSLESQDLIQFELVQADSEGPEFQKRFRKTETSTSLTCSGVTLYIKPSFFKQLNRTFKKLLQRISDSSEVLTINDVPKTSPATKPLVAIPEEPGADIEAKISMEKLEEAVVDKVSFKFDFHLKFIGVILSNDVEEIAQLIISDISSSIVMKSNRTEVVAMLKAIKVLDKASTTVYPEILKEDSENVIKGKVIIYNDASRFTVEPDVEVDMYLGKLIVTVNVDFIVCAYNLFMEIISNEDIPQLQVPAATLTNNDESPTFSKVKFNVAVEAPHIVLPKSPKDNDHILIDLGRINVKNEIEIKDNNNFVDNIKLDVDEVKILSFISGISREILVPFSIGTTCNRFLNLADPAFEINVNLPIFKGKLFHDDVSLLVDALVTATKSLENLKEEDVGSRSTANVLVPESKQVQNEDTASSLMIQVDVGQVVIDAYQDTEDDHPLLSIISDSFGLKFEQKSSLNIAVSLKNVSCIENKTLENGKPVSLLTSSKSDNNIASFYYTMDEEGNQTMSLDVADVSLYAHEVCIKNLVLYIENVLDRLQPLFNMETGNEKAVGPQHASENLSKGKLKFICNLEKLSIWWNLHQLTFAYAQVLGLNFIFESDANEMVVTAKLENMSVEDLRPGVIYPKIVLLEDRNMLACKFSMSETEEHLTDYSLWLRIGRIKVVFLNKFVYEILESIQPFISLASNFNSHDSDVSEKAVMNQEEPLPFLLNLDVDITAPLIYFPKLSTSTTCVVADLGTLTVSNSFTKTAESMDTDMRDVLGIDTIQAKLSNIKLMVFNDGRESTVSKDLSTKLQLSRKIFVTGNKTALDIEATVLPVVVTVAETDIQLFLVVVQSNLNEGVRVDATDTEKNNEDIEVQVEVHISHEEAMDQVDGTATRENVDHEKTKDTESEINVKVHCELMQLHLKSNLLFKEVNLSEDENGIQFCIFSIGNTSMSLSMIGEEMHLDLDVKEISGDDVRPHSMASFKRVLERRLEKSESVIAYPSSNDHLVATSTSQVSLKYSSNSKGEEISVVVVDARTFVNLEFIQDLLEFINLALSSNEHTNDSTQQEPDTTNEAIEKDSKAKVTHQQFKVSCHVNDTEIVLLKDPRLPITPSIVGHVEVHLEYLVQADKTSVDVQNATIGILYGKYPNLKETARPLLLPCQLQCCISMSEEIGTDIDAKIKEMKFSLSPSILSTIIQIGDNLVPKDTQDVEGKKYSNCYVDWSPKPLVDHSLDDDNRHEELVDLNKVKNSMTVSKEKVLVKLNMIELTLGNDLEGMVVPLLFTRFSASASVADWTSEMKVETDLTIEVSHYNEKFGAWEPLLEPNTENNQVRPYELDFKMFYGDSEKIDFSTTFVEKVTSDLNLDDKDGPESEDPANVPRKKALFLVVSSDDVMQLTVTENTFAVVNNFLQGWTMSALRDCQSSQLVAPYQFQNNLEQPVTIYLDDQNQASVSNKDDLTRIKKKTGDLSLEQQEIQRFNPWQMKDVNKKTVIDIQVGHFDIIKNIDISKPGKVVYNLIDEEENLVNCIVLNIDILNGRRVVELNSSIKISNKLSQTISITERLSNKASVLEIEGGNNACLPLRYIALKNIYLQLDQYVSDEKVDFFKVPEGKVLRMRENDSIKFLKVLHEVFESSRDGHLYLAPIHHIKLLPPMRLCNFLPVEMNVTLQSESQNRETSQHFYALSPGVIADVLDFDVSRQTFSIALKYTDQEEHVWGGKCTYNRNHKEPIKFTIQCQDLNQSMEFEVASDRRSGVLELSLYTAFWIVNKTGLDINFKVNQGGEVYILKAESDGNPRMISYDKRKKTKASLQCKEGGWCESFSLSAISDESHIDLFGKENQLYSIHVNIALSNTSLTNIITLSPRCIISNHTEINVVFAEYDCAIDKVVWIDLLPGQCCSYWMHSPQSKILIKEKDSAFFGSAIPFNDDCKFAQRLSSSKTVCVDVNHLGERLIMNVTNYEDGCVPVRVDNYSNVPVFLQQKGTSGLAAIKEYPRNMSHFYNWTEFDKPFNLEVMYENPLCSFAKNVDVEMNGWGLHDFGTADLADSAAGKELCFLCRCLSCLNICKKHNEDQQDGGQEKAHLLSVSQRSMDDASLRDSLVYWVSYLEGMQRVLAFTNDFKLARRLHKSGELDYVAMEMFLSLQGVGVSLLNKEPVEIVYASFTGGTSVWEVEVKNDCWKILDVDTSMLLEDSWKNNAEHARYENKIEADVNEMVMDKPMKGRLRRSRDPALWVEYRQSKSNSSVYVKLHRVQVDSQQYDVSFPSVLYPTPLPEKIIKRNGAKPMLELSAVFTSLHDVMIFKYFKLLLQEVNLKVDRPILTGVMGLYSSDAIATIHKNFYEEDVKLVQESTQETIEHVLLSQSTKVLMLYFHLSPIKIHLSFSLEKQVDGTNTSREANGLLELLISTVGIHFTDISDAVIKLAFFERRNVFLSQDMLLADVTKHYALQAIKQFHVFVLGLDALGNPYGLITEYGKGFKDLFYEPYLGSVKGPHQFAAGLATGVKSLLGHTIGGTAGAAALITEQLGQVVAALSFDSDYKRRRRREMRSDPTGLGEGLALGGKQFVMGLVFGVSGLVTKPVQGAKNSGIEGFFKGIGKGLIGLLVKPTGGVIDLVTSSLDGVRRFAEQSGEDIVVRMRMPRLTYPYEPVSIYSSEKSFGSSIFMALSANPAVEGTYKDHQVIPSNQATIVVFTSQAIIEAVQTKFFAEWTVEWLIDYSVLEDVQREETVVTFITQTENGQQEHSIDVVKEPVCESLTKKTKLHWNEYQTMTLKQRQQAFLQDYVIITP